MVHCQMRSEGDNLLGNVPCIGEASQEANLVEEVEDSPDFWSGPVQSYISPVQHRFLIGLDRSNNGLLPDCDRKYVSVRTMPPGKSDISESSQDTTRPIAASAKSTGGRQAPPKAQRPRKGKSGTSRSRSPRSPRTPSVKRENSSPTSSQDTKSLKSERKSSVNASRSKSDTKIK